MKLRDIVVAILVLGMGMAMFGQARYYERKLRELRDREEMRGREMVGLLRDYSVAATQRDCLQAELKAVRSGVETSPIESPAGR